MKYSRIILQLFVIIVSYPVYADKVSVGDDHTMFITTDGTLWACGFNRFRGVLGDGTLVDRYTPVKIMEHVSHVSAGRYHSLFITEDGTLWGCGNADNGELGVDAGDHTATPVIIMTGVKTATAGGGCSYIVKNDGSLWACGENDRGQLGDGTLEDRKTPVKIMDDVAKVSAGQNHTLILKTDGSLWSCGANNAGDLGDGSEDDSSSPLKIMDDVKHISAGLWHSLIIKTDGSLWGCGGAFYGELGKGEDFRTTVPVKLMDDVVFAAAGQWCSFVIKKDGSLWSCGYNETGILGNGTTDNAYEFHKVMDDVARVYTGSNAFHVAIIKTDGTLLTCGSNSFGQLGNGTEGDQFTPLNVMNGVKETSTRLYHSLILKTDNSLWGCGNNNHGQLGDGTTVPKSTPVRISGGVTQVSAGFFHTMFIKNDGSLWGCGYNESGQLGDGTTEERLTPVKVMEDVKKVSAGGHHTLILKKDGSLWTCGWNSDGRLGTGYTLEGPTSIPVNIMNDVEDVFAGDYHTMIIKKDGSLWVCGGNAYGKLGDDSGKDQTTPVKIMEGVTSASGGRHHSLFVKTDGSLWACGYNGDGQLGDGTKENRYVPVKVMEGVSQASAAGYHSLILKKNGELWTCGRNHNGECGVKTSILDDFTTPVKIMDNVNHISAAGSAGEEHSLLVTSDNKLYACGSRNYGQLGDGKSEVFPGPIMSDVIFSVFKADDITYTLNDESIEAGVKLMESQGLSTEIPEEIIYSDKKFKVTYVEDSVFKSKNSLDYYGSVSFPKSITGVSKKAFDNYGTHCVIWNSDASLNSCSFSDRLYSEGNFLIYVNNSNVAPSGIGNIVINGLAENITLNDGFAFCCPKEFSTKNISYVHNYQMETGKGESAGWETIALPFDVQTISHETKGELVPFANYDNTTTKKPFWLYSLSSNGFIKASGIRANTPYIISMPNNNYYAPDYNLSGKITFSATNTIVRCTDTSSLNVTSHDGAVFFPNYNIGERNSNTYTLNVNNDLFTYYGTEKPGSIFISDYRQVYPFEGYFYKNTSNTRFIDIGFADNQPSEIENLLQNSDIVESCEILDMRGLHIRSLNNVNYKDAIKGLLPGLYLINGKKVIIK